MKNKINFTVIYGSSNQIIETYNREYRNLMFLLRNKIYPDYFGECGGMGRCGTCIVKIEGLSGSSVNKDRNEPVTLSKLGFEVENIRLSCQIYVTEDLNGTIVEILDT
ncbi:MAG: (2Fe-2S)-binding protein [Bacteroidia bacterium]|nr:(2Fe-2S)-binding protein [Bacteroidia bacterium]